MKFIPLMALTLVASLLGLESAVAGRYYDARIARWTTPDPLLVKSPEVSPYVYCHNSPLNRIDSDGKIDWPLKGDNAVNKRDYVDGAWSLKNTVVRTSVYLDTDRPPGASNPHIGVDYRATTGTTFYSLGDGIVKEVHTPTTGLMYVTVEYRNGDQVRFLHINGVAEGVKVGNVVLEGEGLGETGSSGTSAEHLHVDASDRAGNQVDPENAKYGSVSNKEFFDRFEGDATKLKEVKDLEQGKKKQYPGEMVPQSN